MNKKSVVILSGGLDSSTNLFLAAQETNVVLAISFNYGQRAADKEVTAAAALAKEVGCAHRVIELSWFKDFNQSSLIQRNLEVPQGSQVQIDSMETSMETMKSVWVPNRNGIFMSIAAGFAESLGADFIVPGFNLEEASTFPDNSEDYMNEFTRGLSFSTRNKVQVRCWTVRMNKPEILKKALELKLPLEKIWPCYFAEEKWCGRCESCQRSKRAFEMAGLPIEKYFKTI